MIPVLALVGRLAVAGSLCLVAVPATRAAERDVVRITAITRVSTSASGAEADDYSTDPAIAPGGRRVAFMSAATNLSDADADAVRDIFVKDLDTGAVTLVPRSPSGEAANGHSWGPVFSPDGTGLAFVSEASNLVPDDRNGHADIFLAQLATGTITRLSVSRTGSEATGSSDEVIFSPDGRFVVFTTEATNLLPRKVGRFQHIVRKNIRTGAVTCVSCTFNERIVGGRQPAYSSDGMRVVFSSDAGVLGPINALDRPNIYIKNLVNGRTTLVSRGVTVAWTGGNYFWPALSPNGKLAAYLSYEHSGIYGWYGGGYAVRNLGTHAFLTRRATDGEQPFGGAVSFLHDGSAVLVSDGGRVELFFLADGRFGTISKRLDGTTSGGGDAVAAPDGTSIAYSTGDSRLVKGDTNQRTDVFLVTWRRR